MHAHLVGNASDPTSIALFPKKLVASHYCQLIGFVGHQTASMRSSGWAVQRKTQEEIDAQNQVETNWSKFRCTDYMEALDTVMDQLSIPTYEEQYKLRGEQHSPHPHPRGLSRATTGNFDHGAGAAPWLVADDNDWRSSTPDFLFLHREFRLRRADYDRITTSIAALTGIIGGRLGILEARTAKTLTLVAMLFAPPACVASIFSIDGVAGPEGALFWKYWAVAVPLTIGMFMLTYVVRERHKVVRWYQRSRGQGKDWMGDGGSVV